MANVWGEALRALQRNLPAKDYATWIQPIRPGEVREGTATLEVPNGFFRDWVKQYFLRQLTDALSDATGSSCQISFVVNRSLATPVPASAETPAGERTEAAGEATAPVRLLGRLVADYTLDAFVVGKANELAANAAKEVAAALGQSYNPLFVHGGVGLGKTHLLNGIGHAVLAEHPRTRVGCLTAEAFVNAMIGALRRDRMDAFRAKFRRIDLLIIDDVQFLGGKVRSQEEFFHTFNALHDGQKQVVLASDRPPHEIRDLRDCLKSRFSSGLIVSVGLPDARLRAAIVDRKASALGLRLPRELSRLIANSLGGNVRELEGVLNAIRARGALGDGIVSRASVREVLGTIRGPDVGRTLSTIIDVVTAEFGVTAAELASRRRSAVIVEARQVATYLSREATDLPLAVIGRSVGGRDHSTVLYALARVTARRDADPGFRARVDRLLASLPKE